MTNSRRSTLKTLALSTCAALALATAAQAQDTARFDIAGGDLKTALQTFSGQTSQEILFSSDLVAGRRTKGVTAATDPKTALLALLDGTGLSFTQTPTGTLLVVKATQAPQSGSAAGAGAEVEALIVTAQKREEDIQDVPIAISAFTQKDLDAQKIEGGFDLVKAIPNVSFSKNNFTSYNFSIRGVGTKAVSATTDPGVAVAFNNTTIIQNRLFEQEYFDLERVEVLRGPQGTLYGRNATSGVINVISAKPDLNDFDGWLKGEVGNYDTKRISAMVNVPVIEDRLAIRLSGAITDREGYDFNTITKNPINGRKLWSARLTVGFEPVESLRGNFIWERFDEDDNRSRTGKQLCHRDPGPESIGGVSVLGTYTYLERLAIVRTAMWSQGCKPGGLYDDGAFGTPNGVALPFIAGMFTLTENVSNIGIDSDGNLQTIFQPQDPYLGLTQSRNLREVASVRDPIYRASADLLELNLELDITEALTLASQTAYVEDQTYSFQDFNRFNSSPGFFTDTSNLTPTLNGDFSVLAPGGFFNDPQIGRSDRFASFDLAQAAAEQFSQEFRLTSSFEGPINFNVGANYTQFETLVDYYVFSNALTAVSSIGPLNMPGVFAQDPNEPFVPGVCGFSAYVAFGVTATPVSTKDPNSYCPYIDPNPIESINGDGHNYFRSKNPYELESWAAFGEVYWDINEQLKLTVGLRYTDDKKTTIPVPTQALMAKNGFAGGYVSSGHPELPAVKQQWQEWTGRIGFDWKPELSFTNETMVYAFYSHGYKGGGLNPPRPGLATREQILAILEEQGLAEGTAFFDDPNFDGDPSDSLWPVLDFTADEYSQDFRPEFVDAFEIGAKNTLLDGALRLNLTAFYYDYKDYQVSQIRDRTAVNENFDAKTWGLEFESVFSPSRNFQILANFGYLDTEIADGEQSIDIMNRTQGNADYTLTKPWIQLPSNCVIPTHYAALWLDTFGNFGGYPFLCGGVGGILPIVFASLPDDPLVPGNAPYDPDNYPELNGGAGLMADLGGNELPNAPHWTANVGAQYGVDVLDGWRATIRGDVYWQSQSWARVYNLDVYVTEVYDENGNIVPGERRGAYDKLHGWWNANLAISIERPDDGLKIELYAKNILNDTPITDAFLNSDDTALTTNIFVLDPRLIGLSIRKGF